MNELLNKLNSANLSDSAVLQEDNEKVEVIIRPVVSKQTQHRTDEIEIKVMGDAPEIGDAVMCGGTPAENGRYSFVNDENEEVPFLVANGRIAKIDLEDMTKSVIVGGKLVKKTMRTVKKRLSAAQRIGLAKARKKSHTGAALKKRAKSFAKGKAMGLHNAAGLDISTVDLVALGDNLLIAIFKTLGDNYELDEKTIESLEDAFGDQVCQPVVDGNKMSFLVPVWQEVNDEVDLSKFELVELVYELDGKFDSDLLLKQLTDGDLMLQSSLIV